MPKDNVVKLEKFLTEQYIQNPSNDAPHLSIAIRDMLTDLLHLGDHRTIHIQSKLTSAEEIYREELDEMLSKD
jgi:hypothetical protein